ncbi:uncharacterized protein LOC118181260 [Stegodyphus dumicola]|uniref:uncharacterized protein LOC118181260 n=1 Tax=Stegodyphus dumicola TaxID=202533 RepID=UPI0015AE43C8|nr:uncharacterized protein LOC118181260 [Stegodyphus dumicola]
MLLQLFSLTTVLLLQPAWSALTRDEFLTQIKPICYEREKERVLVNGQTMPLASTLENFIALVEKLEAANPNIGLKQELFYLLRSYFHENVEYKKGAGASQWEPPDSNFDKIEILWERNDEERQKKPERLVEPYSEDEKCSLFFMISHSVERYNRFNARFFSPGNGRYARVF